MKLILVLLIVIQAVVGDGRIHSRRKRLEMGRTSIQMEFEPDFENGNIEDIRREFVAFYEKQKQINRKRQKQSRLHYGFIGYI